MPAKENMQNFFGKVDRTFKRQTEEEYRVNQITSPKIAWGPSPEDMDDIVKYCEHHSARTNVMKTIWALLSGTNAKSWKQIYKTLLLIEHLLINACPDTVREIQGHLNIIQTLEDFRYKDEEGVDRGINVRKRAEAVRDLAMSEDIDEKRRMAADTRQRYTDIARNNASGTAANFSVKQKVPIYTSSESVAMRSAGENQASKTGTSMQNMSMNSQQTQGLPTMGLQDPARTLTSYSSQPSLYQNSITGPSGMGMQRPMPRPAGAIPMPAAPMPAAQQAMPMQQAPVAQQFQPIQMLTPQQMMTMTPEQLQAYQQQMAAQQQMLAMMQQQMQAQGRSQSQPQPQPPAAVQQHSMMPMAAPVAAMPAEPNPRAHHQQPVQQFQPQAQAQPPAPVQAQSNNIADLMNFF